MAAQKPVQQIRQSTSKAKTGSTARIVKKYRHASNLGIKRRNGLLSTAIGERPELMSIAKRNSIESPLLRLPPELRNKIWQYALGEHCIDIQDLNTEEPTASIHDNHTPSPDPHHHPLFIRPTFQLPKVCRQTYLESSPYIYTLNTFAFHSLATLDRWIKNRHAGQTHLIASLNIPRTYMRLYRTGLRRPFTSKFPNIAHIGVDNWTLFCDYDCKRRLPENTHRGALEVWNQAKADIVAEIRDREGRDMVVNWHGKSL